MNKIKHWLVKVLMRSYSDFADCKIIILIYSSMLKNSHRNVWEIF